MKRSLELLGAESSGLDETRKKNILNKSLDDNESLIEVDKLSSLDEKEAYLKTLLEKYPQGYIGSKLLLSELVKEKDLKLSYNMLLSAMFSDPTSPKVFYSLAKLAAFYDAFDIAFKSLDIASWLNSSNSCELDQEVAILKQNLLERKLLGAFDNSKNDFWNTKTPEKYKILERIYYESNPEKLLKYCKHLVEQKVANQKDFEDVFKVLYLLKTNKYLKEVQDQVLVSNLTEVSKGFLLGLNLYYSKDFHAAISKLQEVIKTNPLNSKAMLYLALSYLHIEEKEKFIKYSELVLPEAEDIFNAVYFISCALSKQKMLNIGGYPHDKTISKEISSILQSLIDADQYNFVLEINKAFDDLDFYKILSYLPLYMSELFIRKGDVNKAENILIGCTNKESHRIKAWICRVKGDESASEKELIEYRKTYKSSEDIVFQCKMVDLELPDVLPEDTNKLLEILEYSYKRTKEIITDLEIEYGLNSMTCIEATCQDCCTKTFPLISFIEYLYMKNWLDKQDIDFKNQIINKSKTIVNDFTSKYSREPEFVIGEGQDYKKSYPIDFTFDCPCLGDNKCTVYEARPFTCRAYGFTSLDGYKYKGCNYFLEQFKISTGLDDFRKVISTKSFADFSLKIDKKLFGQKILGFIPLWFIQSHDETMEKIKKAISSYSS
jgi:Fe-S-cluster containining protein